MIPTADAKLRAQSLLDRAKPAVSAVLLFYVLQAVALAITVWRTQSAGLDSLELITTKWDGGWFVHIANHGYDLVVPVDADGRPKETALAFFPAYPGLIAATTAATWLSAPSSGLLITAVSGGIAAAGLYFLGRQLVDGRTGTILAALWAIAPGSHVLHMVYSEALFVALVVWCLVALLRRSWLLAGSLAFVAGLTRSTAVAVIAAVMIAALIAVIRRQDGWRPWVAAAVAPLGLLYYLALVGWYAGRLDGWFWVQSGAWGMNFDGGQFSYQIFRGGLTGNEDAMLTVTALIVVGSLALLICTLIDRPQVFLSVYTIIIVVLAMGGDQYWSCRARFLLPAFTLLIPLARLAAKASTRTVTVLLLTGALAAGWYGASLLVFELAP